MSKFDELKRAAEAAIEQEDCDRFVERDDAQSVLELLAIQAQQIKILKSITSAIRDGFKIEYGSIIYHEAIDALAAAGAQP